MHPNRGRRSYLELEKKNDQKLAKNTVKLISALVLGGFPQLGEILHLFLFFMHMLLFCLMQYPFEKTIFVENLGCGPSGLLQAWELIEAGLDGHEIDIFEAGPKCASLVTTLEHNHNIGGTTGTVDVGTSVFTAHYYSKGMCEWHFWKKKKMKFWVPWHCVAVKN